MKLAPMPWMRCGPGVSSSPASLCEMIGDSAGSTAMAERAREALLEVAADAGDGAAGADARDERAELRGRRAPPRSRARWSRSGPAGWPGCRTDRRSTHRGSSAAISLGRVDGALHALRLGGEHELGTERPEQLAALDRHRLGHREDDAVAARGADQRQRDAGVAARRLDDDRLAARDDAARLGVVDHAPADAVLDRAAGVARLELDRRPVPGRPAERRFRNTIGVDPIESSTCCKRSLT